MKLSTLIFIFIVKASIAAPITCEEKSTLYVFFKLKDMAFPRMSEKGQKKTDPLDCDLIANDEFDDLKAERQKRLEDCQTERVKNESRSLSKFILDQTVTAFDDSSCMQDFVDGKFSDLVKSSTNVPDIQALCTAYSPVNQDLFQRAKFCQKLAEAKKNPNSCEIPDANGNCPGAPQPAVENEPPSATNTSNALHWGKVKSNVKRR